MNRQQASEFLGVSQDASSEDVKKAYKKLAMKYHPDRPSGSTELFQKLQEAQDVMNQPQNPFQEAFRGHPGAALFETMFRAHMGSRGGPQTQTSASTAHVFTQTTQTFQLRDIIQGNVSYNGMKLPEWIKDGDTIRVNQTERLQVRIAWPPGVSQHKSGRNNILIRKRLSLDRAILGREFRVLHPDGRPLRVKRRDLVFQTNKEYKIIGEGLPDRNGQRGDMYIMFEIVIPDNLSPVQRSVMERVFPEEPLPRVHHEKDVECVE